MKASQQAKPSNNQQNTQVINYVQSFGPKTPTNYKLNRSLLEKYSFQDNDLSRTSQLISEQDQPSDDEDWLRLEIKQITTIGRELITFYLSVKYVVEYQGDNLPNFDKKKTESKTKQYLTEVKELKSKLVHGSILQSQHKNLVLNLKCKNHQIQNQSKVKPVLSRVEFAIMRIFEAKNQPVLIAKEIIQIPEVGDEYEIGFIQQNPPKGAKPKPVATMIFEIGNSIKEELDGNQNDGTERESEDEEVSEHLQNQDDREKLQNFTVGKSQNLKQANSKPPAIKASNSENVFDNSNDFPEDGQRYYGDQSRFQGNDNSDIDQNESYILPQKSSNVEIIQKLNELSSMIDENLQKSKNQDQAYKSYLEETSNLIEQFQSNQAGQNDNRSAKDLVSASNKKVNYIDKKATNLEPNLKQENINLNPSPHQNFRQVNFTNPNDSRAQKTSFGGQRFQYLSRLQNSNSANTDNEKLDYESRAQLITNKNITVGQKFTFGSRDDDSNIVGERFKYEFSRVDDSNIVGERYDYESKVENINFLDQSNLNDLSSISPVQPNSPSMQKKSAFSKKQPFFQFNASAKRQSNQLTKNQEKSPINAEQSGKSQPNQASSRQAPFNLSELDSSNIRYQYNQNDISNIQETKNMQDLINQIEKIEKEWYEKRVLNRKNREDKENRDNQNQESEKLKPFTLTEDPDDLLDLQLKNFKIKFSEETFYRKLIDGLKNKHLTYTKCNQLNLITETQIPPNYIVFLYANQIDDQNMDCQAENTSKIEIKIASQQIQKLLQHQTVQSPTSKLQEKQIIKTFEKQLYSKVMKIKVNKAHKSDKNGTGEKKKARIIQIALEQESLNLSQIDIEGNGKDNQENRISLIGMYPLPIFGDDEKDGETSFYQNVSIQPLAIDLYDTKTGAQQGHLKFDLAKAKVDQEIQTLEPLQNIEDLSGGQLGDKNNAITEEMSNLLVGYEVHPQHHQTSGLLPGKKSFEKSLSEKQIKEKSLSVKIFQPQTKIKNQNLNAQQRQSNRQRNIQSQASKSYLLQKEQLPLNFSLNLGQTPNKGKSDRYAQQEKKSVQNIMPVTDGSLNKIKTSIKLSQQHRNYELAEDPSRIKESPNKNKDVDMIGKIMKNHSNSLIEPQPYELDQTKIKAVSKEYKFAYQKQKTVPVFEIKEIKRGIPQKNSSVKLYNASNIPHQTAPAFLNYPSSIHENPDNQNESSYFLMKQEFLATANLLESIKVKTQKYIEKVQSERKIHSSDDPQSDKDFQKGFESPGESNVTCALPVEKKSINLQMNSFVVNETILSRKQKSRNQLHIDESSFNPTTIPSNPKAVGNLPSKRTSTNKSRNLKHDPSPKQARRSKFTFPIEKESESLKSQNKNYENYENDNQSNVSVVSQNEKKPRKKDKFKKLLTYKEESDYQFTEQEGRNVGDNRKIKNDKIIKSSNKKIEIEEPSEDELEQSGMNYSRIPSDRYPKTLSPAKSSQRKIKQSAISSYSSSQVIEIKVFSLKIKLLSLPLVAKHLRKLSEISQKGKEYFVLVYTDYCDGGKYEDENVNFMPSVAQKCVRKNESNEDEFFVFFNEKTLAKSQQKISDGHLLIKGVEKTKFIIELYQSSQPPKQSQNSLSDKDLTSLQHISLITLSPQQKKHQNRPFASLSVTFIELLAQQQSTDGFRSRLESSQMMTYTNFLYDKEKILGKININYLTELSHDDQKESNPRYIKQQKSKIKLKGSRKQAIEEFKPLKNSFLKQYSNTRKNNHAQKDNKFKNLRSQSGMTKKLSPRRRKQAEKTEQHSQNQRGNLMGHTAGNQADPLEILKRRLPKSIRSEDKRSSHSQSYAIRLSKPYHTPMNKGKDKELFDSLNSSSSIKFKDQRIRQHRQKNSAFSSSHFEGEPAILQSPKKGNMNAQLMQLRQKKQQKKLKQLKAYQAISHIPAQYHQVQDTRVSQNRKYDGGNIKFGKSSRFNSSESQEMISRKGSKQEIPGPGHYEVKSIFDRHTIKEP